MLRTLVHHARALARQPGFTLVSILTLALGIGANTAMFSVLRSVLLRPLPVEDVNRLVMIWSRSMLRDQAVAEVSFNEYRKWQMENVAFENVAILGSVLWSYRVSAPGEPFDVAYSSVSGTFFDTLGVQPMLGRALRREDDRPDAPRRAILSAGLWRRRFNADRAIVGRALTIGDGPTAARFEIVGVMPPDFDFPRGADLWTAAAPDLQAIARANADKPIDYYKYLRVFYAVGRLKPGVTLDRASGDLQRLQRALVAARELLTASEEAVVLTPLTTYIFGSARPALFALMGAVCLVLLIACANVASLLLARGLAREREIAVRLALGARPAQIVRWLLGESAFIAALGGITGTAVAAASLKGLIALGPPEIPRIGSTRIDVWVLLFAITVSIATALLVGIAPAWQLSRPDLVTTLNRATRGGGAARGRTRRVLVAGEMALTVVLLVAAGLMAQSFLKLSRLDLGFDPLNVLTFNLAGPSSKYAALDSQRRFAGALVERFERVPGVVAAGAVYQRPFENGPIGMDTAFILEGESETPGESNEHPILNWESATPGYFRAMGIRLVSGRLFDDRDSEQAPLVVIVSEAMANRVWPGQDPLGKRLRAYGAFGPGLWQTVVGVVATARYREIDTPRFDLYLPLRQAPSSVNHYVVRTAGDPTTLTRALRHEVALADRDVTMDNVTTMSHIVARTQGPWRFNMVVFGAFAGVAILLAAMGLFGLVAYTVQQRTREIGVRMALGASQSSVVRLMVRQSAQPVLVGLLAGLVASFALTRLVSALLFGVTATDPLTFAGVTAALVGVAAVASYVPARRSARIEPLVALRVE